MDIIYIRELEVATVIVIYDWERAVRQIVSIDLEMATDIAKAARSDSIDDTLNYKAVSKRVTEFVGGAECQLLEALAEEIAQLVLREFEVPWLRLRISKPGAVRGSKDSGVIIERGSKP